MSQTIKWCIYITALLGVVALNTHQFFLEKWMLLQLQNEYVVVSLTTTPHRINKVQKTLSSILQQNYTPQAIYLNIPYVFKRDASQYIIPEWLKNEARVSILRTEDYGPATKLLGTLRNAALPPHAILITLDDDIMYPKNTLLHLAYKAHKNPDRAIAICGSNPEYDSNGNIASNSKTGILKDLTPNANVAIAQGFAGIAYRRYFFDEQIFAIQNAPPACINSDDVYISYYLAQHKVPRQILNNRYINFSNIGIGETMSHSDDALHNLHPTPLEKHRECIAYLKKKYPAVNF